MKKIKLLTLFLLAGCSQQMLAQTPFPTIEYMDVNNIKAASLVHGDMWSNPATSLDACEFPKGSGLNIMGASALWMGGYDDVGNLHVAAATYRQTGNDYWPGPLDNNNTSSYATSQKWAKIWKVNYSDIQTFLSTSTHTVDNTPASILTWPGTGNIYAAGNNGDSLISTMLSGASYAPFVDVNQDGIYEPLQGDYPKMMGDQMLWWMYNDNTTPHTETLSPAFKFEVHVCAYAYHRNTLIDNVIYYQYDIINKSSNTYNSFRVGQFADVDLGYSFDDFVGFDSTFRMGFVYNGEENDSTQNPSILSYGTHIPMAGITMLHLPGDDGANLLKVKSFLTYNNDYSTNGNPGNGAQYNYYLRQENLSGAPNNQSYYLNDPFAECDSSHLPGDRRIVMATDDMVFMPGEVKTVVMALVTTNPDTGHACPGMTLPDLTAVADTAWGVYNNPLPPLGIQTVTAQSSAISLYPNPVSDVLQVKYDGLQNGYLVITDVSGRAIISITLKGNNGKQTIDLHQVAAGMYLYRITDGPAIKGQGKIVKL